MPLIQPRQRVIRPNPLAYPAGVLPGVDRSHPAAQNLVTSAISASGGNMLDLRSGLPFTITAGGSITTPIDGSIGPSQYVQGGATNLAKISGFNSVPVAATIAAIVRPISAPGSNYAAILVYNNGASNNGIYLHSGGGVPIVNMFSQASGDQQGITLGASYPTAPYFIAASDPYSTQKVNFVAVNLVTGQVQTATVTGTSGNGSVADQFVSIGCDTSAADLSVSYIAAAMYSRTYLTMPQLLAWARSPWEFWYPNKTINLVNSAGAAATFLAAWARGSNLPVIGTGNY